jgi:4-amino-4-deoxy-L-arabinose transferase-like glycosyltransferase
MFRLPPWIVVTAVWAAIYLPALGGFEIKSEEGRRILPAVAMLESGNYVVPRIGSDTYFSKPPLVNWLIAASFKISGMRNEWTARLPSVLSILAVALAFITVGIAGLGRQGATAAALIWLTTIGIIEKGRLIEIEAVYVSLCTIALICWLSWWLSKRSPWLTWTIPWIWLGLGWLAKGPVHLIFFYAVVFAVLWQHRQLRSLLHPAHFVGIVLMLGLFAAWAVPFLQLGGQARALTKWSAQFTGRASAEFFSFGSFATTFLRAIGQFLPWVVFAPILRFSRFVEHEDKRVATALAWSVGVPVILVSLVPVSAPRYSLPAAAPFCWLMGLAFSRDAFIRLPRLVGAHRTLWNRLGQLLIVILAVGSLVVFSVRAPFAGARQRVKSVAAEINAKVPQSETLYAIDPKYQPFLFYVRARVQYVNGIEQVPVSANFLLVRPAREAEVAQSDQWAPRRPHLVSRVPDYRNETILLFKIDEG